MPVNININVNVKASHLLDFLSAMHQFATHDVLVGVPEAEAPRKKPVEPKPGKNGRVSKAAMTKYNKALAAWSATDVNNAQLALVHDKGSPLKGIPQREFLEPGIKAVRDQISARMQAGALKILAGESNAAVKCLNEVGIIAQNGVRRKITTGPFKPLSERTLKAREARGVTRTKPLIDTGQLRSAITYVVVPRSRRSSR